MAWLKEREPAGKHAGRWEGRGVGRVRLEGLKGFVWAVEELRLHSRGKEQSPSIDL